MKNIVWKPHQKLLWGNFLMASWVKSIKFQNFTGFSKAKFRVSITFKKQNDFFYNSKTTWGIEMKLWPREQNFFRNILKLKQNLIVFSVHAQMSSLKRG